MSAIPTVSPDLIDPCRFQKPEHYDQENIAAIVADLCAYHLLLNPVHLIAKDGGRWECLGGHDRVEACKRAGIMKVPYRNFTGVVCSDEDIYAHWSKDNALRKAFDKKERIGDALKRWPGWSNRRVAETVGCGETWVRSVRTGMEESGEIQPQPERAGKDGKKQRAARPSGVRKDTKGGKKKDAKKGEEPEVAVSELFKAAAAAKAKHTGSPTSDQEAGREPEAHGRLPVGSPVSEGESEGVGGDPTDPSPDKEGPSGSPEPDASPEVDGGVVTSPNEEEASSWGADDPASPSPDRRASSLRVVLSFGAIELPAPDSIPESDIEAVGALKEWCEAVLTNAEVMV